MTNTLLKRLLATVLFVLLSALGTAHASTTAVVNSTDDVDDGTCDASHCSLREALNVANANPNSLISFNIPGPPPSGGVFTIKPATPLPTITADGTVIDGSTQTSFSGDTNVNGPEVVLDGSLVTTATVGLKITSANCTVRSLVIDNFTKSGTVAATGIYLTGAGATGNLIEGCYVGIDASGSVAAD